MKRISLLLAFLIFVIYSLKERIVGTYVVLNSTETHTHSDDFGKFIQNSKFFI